MTRPLANHRSLPAFKLERYFARYEFTVPHQLASSDAESFSIGELLALDPQARAGFEALGLGYTEAAGHPQLRETLASLYQTCGAQNLLVHAGAQEAIFTWALAALAPGDHVIVQFPCYQSLAEMARWRGCDVTLWAMRERQGVWELDMEELEAALGERTRAIIINTPHNPTGYCFTPEEMERLVALARSHDLFLLADEVYRYSEYEEWIRLPWVCDLYERALSIGVMSKSFGLAGLRLGWAASQDASLLDAMARIKDYTSICTSAPSEFLAQLALCHRDRLLERNLSLIQRNLDLADEFFAEFAQLFVWRRPKAGTIAFPRLCQEGADDYCRRLIQEAGVLLLPASLYDFGDHHVRIGFGRQDFPRGLQRWRDYCREQLS